MTGSLRSVLKDMLIYASGDVLLRATALITFPIYTRILNPADYGVWSYVSTVSALVSAFLILGGDSAYSRFFFEARTLEERQVLTSTWFGFLALWSVGITLALLPATGLLSRWSFGHGRFALLFALSLLTAPTSLMTTLFGQVLRNEFRARLFTVLSVVTTLLSIALGLMAALVLHWGLSGIVGGMLAGLVLMLPVRIWTARALLRPVFSRAVLRKLLAFGVPLVPTSLAWWIFGVSDRVVLARLSTLTQLGLYSVAGSLAVILGLVSGALGQAWSPHAVRAYEEDRSRAPAFYGRMLTYILIGLGLCSVGMAAFARELLTILSTPKFAPAATAVAPLALALVASASIQVTASGISLMKKTMYLAIYAWAAAFLNVGLNVLLVPRFGMLGSSWATFASYVFLTVAYMVTSQRLFPVLYEKRKALVVVALTLAFAVPARYLPDLGLAANLAIKSAYCVAYLTLLVALRAIGRREWEGILSMLRRRRSYEVGEVA